MNLCAGTLGQQPPAPVPVCLPDESCAPVCVSRILGVREDKRNVPCVLWGPGRLGPEAELQWPECNRKPSSF